MSDVTGPYGGHESIDSWQGLVERLDHQLREWGLPGAEARAAATGLADLWHYSHDLSTLIWSLAESERPRPRDGEQLDAGQTFAEIAVKIEDLDLHWTRLVAGADIAGRLLVSSSFPSRGERIRDMREVLSVWWSSQETLSAAARTIVDLRSSARAAYDSLAHPRLIGETGPHEGRARLRTIVAKVNQQAAQLLSLLSREAEDR